MLCFSKQGKKRELRFESLYALEKEVRSVLSVLGLMPPSYHEVGNIALYESVPNALSGPAELAQK